MHILGQWDEPALLAANSSSKQQQQRLATKRRQKLKIRIGVPRAPRWALGPPATILGVLLHPVVRIVRPRGVCWPILPPNGPKWPQTGPEGSGMGARGVRWACLGGGIHSGNVWGAFYSFLPFLPCQWCHLTPKQPQNSPKTTPNGPKVGPK